MVKLKRVLGFWSSVSIAIGAMIGAGVFAFIGVGAGIAGPALILAFIIAGILAFFNAASSAELGASYPFSGGTYEYARRLISTEAGFAAGWLFSVSKIFEAAVVALAFGAYAAAFLPSVDPRLVASIAAVVFTAVNLFGIKLSSEVNNVFVAIKLIALTLLVVAGLGFIKLSNFSPFFPSGIQGVMVASATLFFAYTGYARIATIGEEIKDPKRTIPKSTMTALLITAIVYILVGVVAVGVIGGLALSTASAPLAAVARAINPQLALILIFGGLIATASVLLGDLLATSRELFAMGRNNELPKALSKVDKKYRVPQVAEIVAGVAVIALVLIGNLSFVAALTSLTILLYYAITNASALRLSRERVMYPKILSWLGLIGCILLALFLPLDAWLITAAVLVVGIVYYVIRRAIVAPLN